MMIDRLRQDVRDNASSSVAFVQPEYRDAMLASVERAARFEITDVAEYFHCVHPQERWGFEDFPRVRPPFPVTWMEYAMTDAIWKRPQQQAELRAQGLPTQRFARSVGAILVCEPPAPWLTEAVTRNLLCTDALTPERRRALEATHRVLFARVIVEAADGRFVPMDEGVIIGINEDGTTNLDALFSTGTAIRGLIAELMPVLMALTFLNTVNRKVETVTPSARLQRARQRRGKLPLLSYSVIRVPGVQRADVRRGGHHRGPALHVVRGHFKQRRTGLFWWHPHLRGDASHGVNLSTYKVTRAD